jgi:hypothetical protein
MITLAMNESEANVALIALSYAARHGKEVFDDENESVKQVKGVAARLENNIGDTVIGEQPLQNQ